jgi:hypothetical protein
MQRLTSFFLACALVLVLCNASCTDIITPILTPKEIIPLKVGNEWNYEVANYLVAFKDTLIRQFSVQVVRDTIIEGKKHFVRNIFGSFFISTIGINFYDGYYLYANKYHRLVVKYPVKIGDKYQRINTDINSIPTDTLNIEIVGIDKTVSVKAGTFQCYEEQYNLNSFKFLTQRSAGYGMIQELTYDDTGTLVARTQLTSYTIQK